MDNNYRIEYYKNSRTKEEPVKEFIGNLDEKVQVKIDTHLDLLRENKGCLRYPYASHIRGKIWELRISFGKNYYRIFYFISTGKRIILLHAFLKKTKRTPRQEKEKATNNYEDFISNKSNN